MNRFALMAILFIHPAIAEPDTEKEKSILLMAAALVEMAQQDKVINAKEEDLLKQEFPLQERANPVAVFTLNKNDLIRSIENLNLNEKKKKGFLTFLGLVALADDSLHASEKNMLDRARKTLAPDMSHNKLISAAVNLQHLILHRELKGVLNAIVSAQNTRRSAGNAYAKASIYPPKSSKGSQQWIPNESGSFQSLNWTPPSKVVGSFWIEASDTDFEATGIIDADGDGIFATYVANSNSQQPQRTTGQSIQ